MMIIMGFKYAKVEDGGIRSDEQCGMNLRHRLALDLGKWFVKMATVQQMSSSKARILKNTQLILIVQTNPRFCLGKMFQD